MARLEYRKSLVDIFNLSKTGFVPPVVFVSGSVGSGKTFLLNQCLADSGVDFGTVRCGQIYSSKLFNEAFVHSVRTATSGTSTMKLVHDNPSSMFQVVQELLSNHRRPVFVLIERANILFRTLADSANIISQHFKHLSGLKLCVIFESREPLHALNYPTSGSLPVIFNLPEYTKQEVEDILIKEKPAECSATLYHNYLQTVIGYFYLSTHDLRLLKHVLTSHFEAYSEPVRDGSVSESSVVLLWRKIEPIFRVARASLFLKSEAKENETTLELPYYSKFLLLAAYLASYNPPKTDKRYFLKNAGKIRKQNRQRGPEVKQRLIGPLTFSIDRLIAIFEAITETTDRSATLLSQLRTLVKLKLITVVSSESQILQPKMKSNCSEEFVHKISKTVRFELDRYLFDNV